MTPPLTLLAQPEALERLRLAPVITSHACNNGVVRRVDVTYFDTPERALFNQCLSLSVQRSGARRIQRLRREPHPAGAGGLTWETPVDGAMPELLRFPAPELSDILDSLNGVAVAPVFTRRLRCRVQRIRLPEAMLSVAFSDGAVEAGARSQPIAEVQLKLQSGDPGAVYELGAQLLDMALLRLATTSEYDRGFALALGIAPRPSRAVQPTIARFHVVDDAVGAILDACQRHLMDNQAAAEDGGDPEGVHQLRVALRRLRCALSLLHRAVPAPTFKTFRQEAKWLATEVSSAREWDVFLAETLARPEQACSPTVSFAQLQQAGEQRRVAGYATARTALTDLRTSRLQLQLSQWIERRGWRNEIGAEVLPALGEPVCGLAARLLTRLHGKVLKHGSRVKHLDAVARHRLRVQLKNLRYACEFFLPLWPGAAADR